jgi:hypothetical protein
MINKKLIVVVAAIAVVTIVAAINTNLANAKISSVDTSCTNGGGNEPGGQQPTCSGGGLTQNSENQNPAGNAPSGQNK